MAAVYPKVLKFGTQANYDAIASKDASVLYFTSDTHKIYKGELDFTESARVVSTLPTGSAIADGIIYLAEDTGKVSFYDGSEWHTLALPTVTEFVASGAGANVDDNHFATTKAISDYIYEIIGGGGSVVNDVTAKTGEGSTGKIVVTKGSSNTDVTIPGVGTTLAAGSNTAEVTLSKTTGTADSVVVPGVVTGLAGDESDAATINVTTSTGTHADVVVPKVVTGLAATTGANNEGKISVTLSSGTHADVTVPGVFKDASWNSTTRIITFTDTDGVTSTIDLGKDIFIDQNANNRYENGNIYLYLNDGDGTTKPDTEIVIPVTGLISDYVGGDTDSVELTVDGTTHIVTADVVIRPDVTTSGSEWENALKLSHTEGAKGLYVDLTDVEDSIDALAEAITWGTF